MEHEHQRLYNQLKRLEEKSDDKTERLARLETQIDQWQIYMERSLESITENQKAIAHLNVEMAQLKSKIAIYGTLAVVVVSGLINLIASTFNS